MKEFYFKGRKYVWHINEFKENVVYPLVTGALVVVFGLFILAYACDHPEQFFTSIYWGGY